MLSIRRQISRSHFNYALAILTTGQEGRGEVGICERGRRWWNEGKRIWGSDRCRADHRNM